MVTPLSRIKTMKSKFLILDVEIPPKNTLVEWGMGFKKKETSRLLKHLAL